MNTGTVARLLDVSRSTVCRWADSYREFLCADSAPEKGSARVFEERDIQVLLAVGELSEKGLHHDAIEEYLKGLGANNWQGLPELPAGWWDGIDRLLVPASYVERGKQQAVELERVHAQLAAAAQALDSYQAELQELSRKLLELQGVVAEQKKDLAAKDEMIEQQRKSLQIAQAAVQLSRAQQLTGASAAQSLRRLALFALVIAAVVVVCAIVVVLLF